MDTYIQFIIEHWAASAAFVILFILLIINEVRNNARGVLSISPQKAVEIYNHQNAFMLDIRKKEVFEQCHLIGATNVPFETLQTKMTTLMKYKSKPVILTANSVKEATDAGRYLKGQGFEKVMQIAGGLSGWQSAGLPVVKS